MGVTRTVWQDLDRWMEMVFQELGKVRMDDTGGVMARSYLVGVDHELNDCNSQARGLWES